MNRLLWLAGLGLPNTGEAGVPIGESASKSSIPSNVGDWGDVLVTAAWGVKMWASGWGLPRAR